MKNIALYLLSLSLFSCSQSSQQEKTPSGNIDSTTAKTAFSSIKKIAGNAISSATDSTHLLILPLEASCPSCREKTIDSILKHYQSMPPNHLVIISAPAGRRSMSSYFKERNGQLPEQASIILDTTNLSTRLNLHENNPTIYTIYGDRVTYKKSSLPATVKTDLHHFFSPDI